MRRKNAAVLMTAVIIGGLLTSCGSAYNNANGKNSDNTVETQTTVRTVVNGETKTDGNNVKTADKETRDFTQEVTSEENNLTDNDIAGNTEASEQQAFDDLSQAGGYENNSGQESWEDSDSGDVEHLGEKNENNKAELGNSCEENYNTSFFRQYDIDVIKLVNAERQKCGIEPLELDAAMCKAAGIRAVELDYTGKLSHSRPNRPQNDNMSGSALDECGVSWEECGENIAGATYEMTPEELVKSWMNSPAHKENILDPIYTKMGLGYSNSGSGAGRYSHYWAQEFAG